MKKSSMQAVANRTGTVEDLPAHHNDPFDRILVAQALIEPPRWAVGALQRHHHQDLTK